MSEAGAEVIAVPAAFTVPTGRAHWQVLMRARAIEAELFVVAAAQAGRHEDGRETYGHSLVADPWGELLLEMGGEPGLGLRRDRPRPDRRRQGAHPGPPASPADPAGGELIRTAGFPKGTANGSVAQQDRAVVS